MVRQKGGRMLKKTFFSVSFKDIIQTKVLGKAQSGKEEKKIQFLRSANKMPTTCVSLDLH